MEKVPLSTAETIVLKYFSKGYTKELKKDIHLLPLCKELSLRKVKGMDKNQLIMILAKELLKRKKVTLSGDADFYFLHRESIIVHNNAQ